MATFFGDNLPNNYPGTPAADTIFGAGGNDILNGAAGNDNIYGDSGNDSLNGGLGLNFLYGGEGNDTLNAFDVGIDDLFGGIGDDVYIVSTIDDNVVEGLNQGIDIVWSSATYTLDANVENLLLRGVAAVDGTGNALDNQITGNSASNNLSGLGGNDTLNGAGGNDILTGGVGSDQFVFDTALPAAGVDRITDFSIPGAEKIVLDKTVFSALETVAGNPLLAADFSIINVPAALEANTAGTSLNEIVYNSQTGGLFYNPNNNLAGFGPGGGRFATVQGFLAGFSNTAFRVVA